MIPVLPGATSQSVYFKAIDNTSGLAATTVTSATAGLSISYQNTQTGTVTAISLSDLATANSAWSSGGMKHIAGGVYRLCIPDAAVPATEGARTIISGTATAFQILGCELVGKPVEVVSGSLVAASVSGAVGSVTGAVGSVTGNVGGNVTGSVGSVATGGITATSIAADAIGASELAADAVAEIQSGLATSAALTTAQTDLTTLTGRLTSARAGYLDNLSAGAVALASSLTSTAADITTILGRVTAAVATAAGLSTAQADLTTLLSRITGAVSLATATTAAAIRAALGMGAANLDTQLDALPTAAENADAVWDEATSGHATAGTTGEAITSAGSTSAAGVWSYATRTLTQGASSVTAAVTGSSVTVYRGTRWSIPLTGLPTNTGYTAIILSVKRRESDADSAAIFQVRTTAGLTAFAGAPTVTAGQAAITVNSSTAITITCEAATTVYATPGTYSYGIKYLDASGYPSQASDGGVFTIAPDIPKAIS